MRKRLFFTLKIVVALFAITVLYVFSAQQVSRVQCPSVQVFMADSQRFVSRVELLHQLSNFNLVGKALSQPELNRVRDWIKSNPYVLEATVSKDLDGTVAISVTQKHPLLIVNNLSGEHYFIDDKGRKLPFFKCDTSELLSAENVGERLLPDTVSTPELRMLLQFSRYIKNNPDLKDLCGRLCITSSKEVEVISRRGNIHFAMGDTAALPEKFDRLRLMYSVVFPKEGLSKYSQINLKYEGQLICTKNNNPINN